jgi:hypothetical protein
MEPAVGQRRGLFVDAARPRAHAALARQAARTGRTHRLAAGRSARGRLAPSVLAR